MPEKDQDESGTIMAAYRMPRKTLRKIEDIRKRHLGVAKTQVLVVAIDEMHERMFGTELPEHPTKKTRKKSPATS